jgi:hypothetical protein
VPRVEEWRELPVPLRQGFDYITNVANWTAYWPSLVDIPDRERISWSKPGDEATVVVRVRGEPVAMDMKLEEFRPYDRVVYRSEQPGLPDFHHERHWRGGNGSFEYGLVIEFQPRRRLSGLIDRIFVSRIVKRSLVETMDNLERIFRETGRG